MYHAIKTFDVPETESLNVKIIKYSKNVRAHKAAAGNRFSAILPRKRYPNAYRQTVEEKDGKVLWTLEIAHKFDHKFPAAYRNNWPITIQIETIVQAVRSNTRLSSMITFLMPTTQTYGYVRQR